jgi:gas vesicle protein
MRDDRGTDPAAYLGWFLLGGVLGAAAALLLAPRTGRETREILAERSGDVARRAQELASELANEAQGRAGEWLDKSRELFEEQTQRLMSAFEAGKDAMREETRKSPAPPRG